MIPTYASQPELHDMLPEHPEKGLPFTTTSSTYGHDAIFLLHINFIYSQTCVNDHL